MRTIPIDAAPLTEVGWAPFGWVPVSDLDPRDVEHDLEFLWGDPHVNVISHRPDEVERTDDGTLCTVMYRHATHTQTLMPLNVDSIVVVAPASVDFSRPGDVDTVRAFLLRPLDRFVLFRGTWHWGPFPLAAEPVELFNVQGARYADDNASVDLPSRASATFEVRVPSA